MRDVVEESFNENEYQKMKWLQSRPVCDKCHREVQEDRYWVTEKYPILCENCLDDYFWEWKKDSDNYVVVD